MLKGIPTEAQLSRLYDELGRIGAACVGAHRAWPYGKPDRLELLKLASEMLRYDPRLLTILVTYCLAHFPEINPTAIRAFYDSLPMPQVWGVIAEFMLSATEDRETRYWAEYLQRGMLPAPLQFFYHHLYRPGGPLSTQAIEGGLSEYKRWGFLACERPTIDAQTRRTVGSWDKTARLNILSRLLRGRKEVRLSDYMRALHQSISRQQALADLKSMERLVQEGHGRGATWRLAG